jgi:hypothetical protein
MKKHETISKAETQLTRPDTYCRSSGGYLIKDLLTYQDKAKHDIEWFSRDYDREWLTKSAT